ncbi:hypothetical protein EDB83DRAFT_2521813 [Lactarius deliciosus]|nr:hypothetical protein EDB83DRAFT_2521813 [Lactarius deliciosus]
MSPGLVAGESTVEQVALPQGPAAFTAPSSPVVPSRVSTPLSYAEGSPDVEYVILDLNNNIVPHRSPSPDFDIRTQVAVRSGPLASRSPSPELVYPDPAQVFQSPLLGPLSPLTDLPSPSVHLVSPHPRSTSLPPHFTDSPIDYNHVAEGVPHINTPDLPHENQENIPPPLPLIRPPSCVNVTTGPHPHQYINVQTPQGEEWHPISEFYQTSLTQIPSLDHLLSYPLTFPGVIPLSFPVTPLSQSLPPSPSPRTRSWHSPPVRLLPSHPRPPKSRPTPWDH